MEPQGPPGVAEPPPPPDRLARLVGGQRSRGGPALEPCGVRREDPCDRRLLEHHLADKDGPCAGAGAPPRQVACGAGVPRRSCRCHRVRAHPQDRRMRPLRWPPMALSPVGPLPASTYWRRRLVLLLALIAVVLLARMAFGGDSAADGSTASPKPSPSVIAPSP